MTVTASSRASLAWGYMAASWEAAWFPAPVEEIPDPTLAMAAGLATLAHAVACRDPAGRLAPGGRQPQRSFRDGAASYRIREQPPAAGATPIAEGRESRALS